VPQPIEDPAPQGLADAHRERPPARPHLGIEADTGGVAERQEHRPVLTEADHLGQQGRPGALHLDQVAEPEADHGRLQRQAGELGQASGEPQRRGPVEG
jgi:hypothetical protein